LRRKDKEDITSQLNKIDRIVKTHSGQLNLFQICIFNISKSISMLFENEEINTALEIQDEQDRHKVALWGTRGNSKKLEIETPAQMKEVRDFLKFIIITHS
jgi:hypothetical protein